MEIKEAFKTNLDNGIIYITVNTEHKWIEYQINRMIKEHSIQISFYDEDYEISEIIEIDDNFNPYKYKITSQQEKDQIYITIIPITQIFPHKTYEKLNVKEDDYSNT